MAAAAEEHLKLARDAAAEALLRKGGWIKAYRSERGHDLAHGEAEELKPFGIKPAFLDRAALTALKPHVGEKAIGGVHYTEPLSTPDPGALIQRLCPPCSRSVAGAWREATRSALSDWARAGRSRPIQVPLAARDVVIALGPWSDELARRFGLSLPFFVKRGYHMHYEAKDNVGLIRPVLDLQRGYLVTPMAQGLRLTTGAEFARRDDPPSAAQLRAGRAVRAGAVPHRGAQGRDALARPAPVPARHAPGHRAVPRQARPVARLRPPPPGAHARTDHRAASGRNDLRRGAFRRSRPVQGGSGSKAEHRSR